MKRIILLFTIFILLFAFSVQIGATEDVYKDTLRVGISYGNSAKATASFYSDGAISVYDVNTDEAITYIPAGMKFTLTAAGSVVMSDCFECYTNVIRLESESTIFYNDKEYRGAFEVRNNGDLFRIINIVSMDDYLASLLGREMSTSWPIEALKAQAVCARNYVLTIGGKHSSYGFDICTEQHCQVYGGVASEADSTRRAVEETQGVIVTYKDKVVPLYYFSCDGGYTEDSENVWISAEGYLRGKKDIYENPQYAKLANWSTTYTKSQIEDILTRNNVSIGSLKDIVIEEMSDNNGVIKLTFLGEDGEKTVTKSSVRSYLSLKSNAFTIEKHVAEEDMEEATEAPVMYVMTQNGLEMVSEPGFILSGDGLYEIPYEKAEEKEPDAEYTAYTFNGHGYGHLVGMSQWGAFSMAVEGYSYRDILRFYFTDIEIVENEVVTEDEKTEFVTDDETGIAEEAEYEEKTEAESEGAFSDTDVQWSDTGI